MSNIFKKYPVLSEGIINLKSGTSFKGVIYAKRGEWLVLRSVEILQDRNQAVNKMVDGEIIVKMVDVDFIQVL